MFQLDRKIANMSNITKLLECTYYTGRVTQIGQVMYVSFV